jgi:hypothetical protein
MMIPPERFDGLEGLDRRRRHRLDARRAGRPALGGESGDGYFGVAPGPTQLEPNAMKTIAATPSSPTSP